MQIIMVVDDSPVIRKVANRILSDMGYVVVEAEDGIEALSKARHNLPDAMIVDWDLPAMTGIELIQEFRKLEGSGDVKVLYCTSELMVSDMTKAKRAGADGFLMKPFNRKILNARLNEVGIKREAEAAA